MVTVSGWRTETLIAYMEDAPGDLAGHTLWSLRYGEVMRNMVMGPNPNWIGTVNKEKTFTTSGDIASGWSDAAMAVYNYVIASGVGLWGTARCGDPKITVPRLAHSLNVQQATIVWDITAAYRKQVKRVQEVVARVFEPAAQVALEVPRGQPISAEELEGDDDWWAGIGSGVGIGEEYEEVVAGVEAAYRKHHDWRYNPDTGALISMEEWIWLGYGLGGGDVAGGSSHQGTAYHNRRPE
jgi:hypothetical protein